MCGNPFAKPDIPAAPAPPPPPKASVEADGAVQMAREEERKRARAAAGAASTVRTGSQGLTTQANTTNKTLVGQ